MNIEKKQNGFQFNSNDYLFNGEIEIISESQVHVGTDKGTILFDLTCTIDGKTFDNIDNFKNVLIA